MKTRLLFASIITIVIFSCGVMGDRNSKSYNNNSILTNKKDVRKTGSLELKVNAVIKVKNKIVESCEKYNAQIISEDINDNSEEVMEGYYTIKVKAENFSVLFDDLSKLGKTVRSSIQAEDISDEKTRNNEQIELLNQRIKNAENEKDLKLADSLKEKLSSLIDEQKRINSDILYSYIYLQIKENIKFIQSITSGIKTGINGFYYAIKYTIIAIMYLLPLLVLLFIIRLFYALIKSKWKYFINKTETLLDKKKKKQDYFD